MSTLVLSDVRQYVFGLFFAKEIGENVADHTSLQYLGTAFFITSKGDAVTANHVLPELRIEDGDCVVGIMLRNGKSEIYKLHAAARFEDSDFALLKFDILNTPYFELNFEEPGLGEDVIAFGYSDHERQNLGKELRLLKGYLTMPIANGAGELSFAIPRGMSGGPILVGTKCVGFMIGNFSTERLLTQSEEITEVYDSVEKITFVESKEVLHYGIFRPFSIYKDLKTEIFNNKSLEELIGWRNKS